MEFSSLLKHRKSCRNFKSDPVAQVVLRSLMEAVRMAPSAVNYQPYCFYVVQTEKGLKGVRESYKRSWFQNFPICIVACGDHRQAWHRADGKDYTDIDVAIAVEHLVLAAANEGLGACWVCNFDKDKVSELLKLEYGMEPIALIPIGYPNDENVRDGFQRKSLDELFKKA